MKSLPSICINCNTNQSLNSMVGFFFCIFCGSKLTSKNTIESSNNQYKIIDGKSSTYFPTENFVYDIAFCVLGSLVGFLIFYTMYADFLHRIVFPMDDIFSIEPEFQFLLLKIIVIFVAIILSFLFSIYKIVHSKRKLEKLRI